MKKNPTNVIVNNMRHDRLYRQIKDVHAQLVEAGYIKDSNSTEKDHYGDAMDLSHWYQYEDNTQKKPAFTVRLPSETHNEIKLAAKPQWYHYYRTRNLWLIACHYHRSFIRIFFVFIRTFAEAVLIAFGWERTNKFNALKLQFQGLIHGLLNQKGKKEIPQ